MPPTLRDLAKSESERMSDTGPGVAFDGPQACEALEALHEIARATASNPERQTPPAHEQACQRALDAVIPKIMAKFFDRILTDLLDAADRAESTLHQTAYFDAVTVFKNNRGIGERFRAEVLRQAASDDAGDDAEPDDPRPETLSLLEKEPFEDWLNLVGEATKLETVFEAPLRVLDKRLSSSPSPHATDEAKKNPYGPLALGRAFRKATEELPLANSARRVSYKTLSQAMHKSMAPFYRRLLELTATLESADRPAGQLAQSGARKGKSADGASKYAGNDMLRPAATGSAGMAGAATRNLSGAFAALNRLNTDSKTARTASGAKPADWTRAVEFASELFHHRLREPQMNALHLLGAVISTIAEDPSTPTGLQPLLKQWQWPLLNLAIRDPQILDDAKSPARRLLDTIDRMALAADNSGHLGEGLTVRLNEWTERLAKESARDPGVVERAAIDLEGLTEPLLRARNLRIQRLREACESQQRIERARRRANAEIHRRLAGATIPRIVPELLDIGWRDWLVQTYLRGDSNPESQECLEALDRVLMWLDPVGKLPDPDTAYRIIELVEDRLWPRSLDPNACRSLIDELAALLIQGKPPDRIEWSGETADATEGSKPRVQDQPGLARLRSIRVGDWFRVVLKPGSAPVPLSIAWIDEDRETFVFSDRQGNKRLELDSKRLSHYLDDRRAERAQGFELPLSERVVSALMQSAQENARYRVHFDPTTGLLNQKGFNGRLAQEFTDIDNVSAVDALCVLEIDQFHSIVSLCGHEGSERLLREVAEILKQQLECEETMARIADNRFGALHTRCELESCRQKTERAINAIADYRFHWKDRSFAVSVHAGMVEFRIDAATPSSVFKHADTACMRAKEKGVGHIQIYNENDAALSQREQIMDWGGRIDRVLSENRLFTRCQKIAPLDDRSGIAAHYEMLLGIRDADGRPLSPADFLAAAERWNRASDIDRAQIESVFDWIRHDPARLDGLGGVSINLSAQSVNSDRFMELLHAQLATAEWSLEKVTFEITETAAIADFAQADKFIRRIRRHGCRFALDDFGSGFASYAYLKNLQVDFLKIDGAFVRDLAVSEADYAMVKSMNEVGHSLGIKTIAEYVESEEILAKLREIGVDYVQGYCIGKPMLLTDLR